MRKGDCMSIFTNAMIVLEDEVINGSLVIEDGRIAAIEPGRMSAGDDLGGDYVMPGIIDLHTDNLERQVMPRSTARWPSRSALLAHDAQCAAAGITTVFDALALGDIGFEKVRESIFENGLRDLQALAPAKILKAEHFLHLRCELPAPEMPALLRQAIDDPLVRLVSIMDHSPGHGQFADAERYRRQRAIEGFSDAEIDAVFAELRAHHLNYAEANRHLVLELVRARKIPLASHDDRLGAEVRRNHADGITISEFPVSMEAAKAAASYGIRGIAGAPNIVRGGSHSGNVSALELVREGLVCAVASDYVPASMLEAAFICARSGGLSLPQAVALISAGPAALAGLDDRGRIAPGLRADLVQVRLHEGLPVVRAVWREGNRIA
jgi:alpha-D-ribose 1-methylphosphonate 5-triphosphate diphosphatase